MNQSQNNPEKKFDLWEGAEILDNLPPRGIYTHEHTWEMDEESPRHWVCTKCGLGKYSHFAPEKPVDA
jgi:hypothetical protein